MCLHRTLFATGAQRKVTLRETVGTKPARVVEKAKKKGRWTRNVKEKGTISREGDNKKKGPCHNCDEFGHFARECPKKKESNNSNSSAGRVSHCLTYTDDQSQWIMMLAENLS